MTEEKIKKVMGRFSAEAKRIYGTSLRSVILYGSCARGNFEADSDIDILILLDMPRENISEARKKMLSVSDRLDWDYDVVLALVFQNYQVYQNYMAVSKFYQNVQKEGIQYA